MQIHSPLHPRRIIRLKQYITRLSGLVAYYPMQEGDGAVAVNHAPDNLRSLNGAITGATVGQAGEIGRAYSFDGINDIIELSNPSALQLTDQSFICLINTTDANGGYLFATTNGTNGAISWYQTASDKLQKVEGADVGSAATDAHNDGSWHLIGVTRNGTTGALIFYLNGATNGTGTSGTTLNHTIDKQIGGRVGSSTVATRIDAILQHMAIFNTVLTNAQMLKLAQIAGTA